MDTDHKTINQENETQELAQCPHCGSMKDPWFSRVMPMSYHCQDCGKDVDADH